MESEGTDFIGSTIPGCRNLIIVIIIIMLIMLMIALIGCSATVPTQFEGQIVVTKKYAGRLQYYYFNDGYTSVITDRAAFQVCGQVDIPDSSLCYIRTLPVYVDCSRYVRDQLQRKYFSFDGDEYRVKTW